MAIFSYASLFNLPAESKAVPMSVLGALFECMDEDAEDDSFWKRGMTADTNLLDFHVQVTRNRKRAR